MFLSILDGLNIEANMAGLAPHWTITGMQVLGPVCYPGSLETEWTLQILCCILWALPRTLTADLQGYVQM